jgi:hypothetical protein
MHEALRVCRIMLVRSHLFVAGIWAVSSWNFHRYIRCIFPTTQNPKYVPITRQRSPLSVKSSHAVSHVEIKLVSIVLETVPLFVGTVPQFFVLDEMSNTTAH